MVDDLLSQEEIDQLLGGVSEGEEPVELSDLERDTPGGNRQHFHGFGCDGPVHF